LRAVISLPQVFKNNNARMAIIYAIRNPNWNVERQVLLATVLPKWTDENGEVRETDLAGELETIVDRYLNDIEPANTELPEGNGLGDFPELEQDMDAEEERGVE